MSAKEAAPTAPTAGRDIADRVNRVFRRLLVLTVLLALTLAGLFGYLLVGLRPLQDRYQDGARALQLAHAAMIDQVTGLRGYLLVRDDVFLQP
jgi:CHASE3 domain sensor protein